MANLPVDWLGRKSTLLPPLLASSSVNSLWSRSMISVAAGPTRQSRVIKLVDIIDTKQLTNFSKRMYKGV